MISFKSMVYLGVVLGTSGVACAQGGDPRYTGKQSIYPTNRDDCNYVLQNSSMCSDPSADRNTCAKIAAFLKQCAANFPNNQDDSDDDSADNSPPPLRLPPSQQQRADPPPLRLTPQQADPPPMRLAPPQRSQTDRSDNNATISQERQPCSIPGVGFIANNKLDECARIAQAYRGQGTWGDHQVQMANGRLTVDGKPAGMVPNYGGNTVGSLSQRCQGGDTSACDQLNRQTGRATDDYTDMMRQRNLGGNR